LPLRITYDGFVTDQWKKLIEEQQKAAYFTQLTQFIDSERTSGHVFPLPENIFAAFDLTPCSNTRVVIIGQDPYHGHGQAHGLCFSVQYGVAIPPSLRNIFAELKTDLGIQTPAHGNLTHWAEQGVLLLNTTLTVRSGEPGSHVGFGWETFTDAVIRLINDKADTVILVLWGANAQKKKSLITMPHHIVLESAHPSPLSAYRGFFGSRPFSRINTILLRLGTKPIDWSLPISG